MKTRARHWLFAAFAAGLLLAFAPSCGTGTPKCAASNCSGCCDGAGKCQTGLGAAACGARGQLCNACSSGQSCQSGQCLASAGGGSGGGGIGGGVGGGTGGGGTGGGGVGGGTGGGGIGGGTGGGGTGGGSSSGQCLENSVPRAIVNPGAGQLVITEVMANPFVLPDAIGEWFEVQATAAVDLNGLAVNTGTGQSALSATECVRVNAGQYAVIARSADAGIPNVRATFNLSLVNAGGLLGLTLDDAGIDFADVPAALDGISWQLDPATPTAADNDDPDNFCDSTEVFGDPDGGDFGTPGTANSPCPVLPSADTCVGAGGLTRAIVRPAAGDLVISEVMADPSKVNDVDGEWFEVVAKKAIDLNGLVLVSGANFEELLSVSCLTADAGTHLVFARAATASINGGLPAVTATFGFALVNGGGTLSLENDDAGVLDVVTFPAAVPGASLQLDRTKYDVSLNDLAANFCLTDAGVSYGPLPDGGVGDRGTPGALNKTCP